MSRHFFALIAATFALSAGCSEEPITATAYHEEAHAGLSFRTVAQYDARLAELASFDDTNGQITLGRGYNAYGNYADALEVTRPVLDYDALDAAGLIDAFSVNKTIVDTTTGESLEDYANNLAARATISGESGRFSGSASVNFASATRQQAQFAYTTAHTEVYKRRVQILETNPADLRAFLTDNALEDIDGGLDVERLIDTYGTHVLLDVFLGGRVDYNMAMDMSRVASSKSLEAAVRASYGGLVSSVDVEAEFASEEERETFETNSQISLVAYGGDNELLANPLDPTAAFEEWKRTIDDHQVLMGFAEGVPMIGLWELAADPDRRDDIKKAIDRRADGLDVTLEDGPMRALVEVHARVTHFSDQGTDPNLEVYGQMAVAAKTDLDLVLDMKKGEDEQLEGVDLDVLFDREKNDYRKMKEHRTVFIGSTIVEWDRFDPHVSGLELYSDLTDRDPGTSGDDRMGIETQPVLLREPVFVDGKPSVKVMTGRHTLRHKSGKNSIEVYYDVAILGPND